MEHSQIVAGEIHSPYQWIVVAEADRNAIVPEGVHDLYKLCLQTDTGDTWRLSGLSPAQWVRITDQAVLLHIASTANPHGVTAEQVGAEPAGAVSMHEAAVDPHPQYATAAEAALAAPVQSVAGRTGVVVLAKSDVGLANVDNTSDADKPVSTAQQTVLNAKLGADFSALTEVAANAGTDVVAVNQSGSKRTTLTKIHDWLRAQSVEYAALGIRFPATQFASADANTLDDYEEGTFTPTLYGIGTAGSPSYTSRSGRYTKLGNRCLCTIIVVLSAKDTVAGQVAVSGLPFTIINMVAARGGVTFGLLQNLNLAAAAPIYGLPVHNASYFAFYKQAITGAAANLVGTEITDTFSMYCSLEYEVA